MSQTATIVITDLVDSTAMRIDLGEDAADRLRSEHDARLSTVAENHGGTVIKGTGDGLIVAFAGATEALHACVALQQAVHTLGRREGLPLAARVGVSAGDVSFEDGDCFGSPVIEAARLCSAAKSSQILVADLVRLLARGRGGLGFGATSDIELKGLPEPLTVHLLDWEPAAAGTLEPGAATPYVGRDREMAMLQGALDRAMSGSGAVALIAGEPGIGKTRLIDEFCHIAAEEGGCLVLFGSCHDGDVVANAPLVEAISSWARRTDSDSLRDALGPEAPVLARLAPALRTILPEIDDPLPVPAEAETARLRDCLAQVLLRAASLRPVLLVLDDLHWADVATVDTLRALARATRNAPVLIIGGYRDTDLDRRHPFAEALGILHREVDPVRITLSGLDSAAVKQLLTELADQDVTAGFAQMLADETEGNPFFLRETVLHLVEEGRLRHDGDAWVIDGAPGDLGVPAGIREVIGRRLSRLSDDANKLLATGALSEVTICLPVAAAVTGIDEATALDAIDAAIAAGIVRPTPVFDEYRFTHALFRHVLVEEMNPSRQVRAHRAIVEVLEQRVGATATPAESATLLRHYENSAAMPGAERGADHALAVAEDAARRFAPFEEYTALNRALDLLGPDDPRALELLVRRAQAAMTVEVDLQGATEAATSASAAVMEADGADAACSLLAGLLSDSFGSTSRLVWWMLADLAAPHLRPDRRDGAATIIRYVLAGKRDHFDPDFPGIMRDSPERHQLRDMMVDLAPDDLYNLILPTNSFAEAESLLEKLPHRGLDKRGYRMVPTSLLLALGRVRQLADDLEWSSADAIERGWYQPVAGGSTIRSRALNVLGDHDESDAAMALAQGVLDRLPDTSNSAFQTMGGELLRAVVRGRVVKADDLGPLLPFVELPDTSWAGLAIRSAYARALGFEGRRDEATDALRPVLAAVEITPPYFPNLPMIIADAIDALWVLNDTEGLDCLERNLRAKVVEPDIRYPEVDGRWSLALACALTGRVEEAEGWFAEARRVMAEQGTVALLVGIDLDEAIMWQRIGGADAHARARVLLDQARSCVDHPAMEPWLTRIDRVAERVN